MPPARPRPGTRTIGVPRENGTAPTGKYGGRGKSRQSRWVPAAGQAAALADLAEKRTEQRRQETSSRRAVSRSDLIRQIAAWGLQRGVDDVRRQGEVPAAPDSTTPRAEKSVHWTPTPGLNEALDLQADAVGDGVTRNELLRRHAAAWMALQEDAPNSTTGGQA